MRKMTVAQTKQIDLVDYLASLGHYPDPKKSRNGQYWYLSPLPDHDEKIPSFKVDRRHGIWFDHGLGVGGTLIDFGIRYHGCSVKELREKLSSYPFLFSHHFPLRLNQSSRKPKRKSACSLIF